MSSPTSSSSTLLRFFDSFLQEKNIKWLLCAGVAIVLCSSAMLVTSHWNSIDNSWRFLILCGYVGFVHVAGQWVFHHWSLRQTGHGLMALTILLLPLTFVTWHLFVLGNWLQASAASQLMAACLLVANGVFACLAADRIFRHFLRGRQLTFTVCYLLLCYAGAAAPSVASLGAAASVTMAIALWGLFLVGSVKVNRHVFWLVESHQAPRIYGFLPVMLLGGQFIGLFAANFMFQLPTDWLGFGLVLFSVPLLLTADTVASVFKQRSGGLITKLPPSIALPWAIGIISCLSGVVLAASPLAFGSAPFALVPTAAAAACIFAWIAIRTRHEAFVYVGLVCTILTYQTLPVFFSAIAKQVAAAGAAVVNESRLPYAFYGLTYLPLLILLTAAAWYCRRRAWPLFAKPLKNISIALPLLLVGAAFSEPSLGLYPALLVCSAMSVLFACQTRLFRQPGVAIACLGCTFIAAGSCVSFVNQVWHTDLSHFTSLIAFATTSLLVTVFGRAIDIRLDQLVERPRGGPASGVDAGSAATQAGFAQSCTICQLGGLLSVVGGAAVWLAVCVVSGPSWAGYAAATILAAGLMIQCLTRLAIPLSAICYAFYLAVFAFVAVDLELSAHTLVQLGTGLWLGQWVLDYVFERFPQAKLTRAFQLVNRYSATLGLWTLLLIYHIPQAALAVLPANGPPNLLMGLALMAWMFDAARKWQIPIMAYVAYTYGLLWSTVATTSLLGFQDALYWLPLAWLVLPILSIPAIAWLGRRHEQMASEVTVARRFRACLALLVPICIMSQLVFATVGVLSLTAPYASFRIAGFAAAAGLWVLGRLRKTEWLGTAAAALLTWTVIAGTAQFLAQPLENWSELFLSAHGWQVAGATLVGALAMLIWRTQSAAVSPQAVLIQGAQRALLPCATAAGVLCVMSQAQGGPLEMVLTLSTLAIVFVAEAAAAVQTQRIARAWLSLAVFGFAISYCIRALGLPLDHVGVPYGLLLAGFSCTAMSMRTSGESRLRVFAQPTRILSNGMPIFVAVVTLLQQVANLDAPLTTFSFRSLAMLVAAGFYFWRGMECTRHQPTLRISLFTLAAAIANVALMLVWVRLDFTDPQVFLIPIGASVLVLVETVRRDLPAQLASALRYAGALVILVSPTFNIIGGSWLHMLTLMITAVLLILLSIGVRAKPLLYMGTAFLAADLTAMVARGCWDRPGLLWLAGIVVGGAVVGLAALAENSRERLLQQVRMMSAQLQTWS